ncbi:hypothetical protein J2Y45_003090 [Dyadobacter sp. BE34]|uniref:Uncharacterized protein n=1 Tax=Dyadobacter fermentans TaxID=94254 RepID=A0ABU1QUE4_9BACT|nr:hypothetical protein [Dyadobacter fermentans]MDR7043639.1 hypothetical protein [Dyadobacter sp. BE242]MDR7197951.1 hypothetical protein [Dyadobacter sp. BE34]MDR7214616.1 hypothetical protein [Dyadobacter sp. BE31]MDR7262151.1 hypothetical protein [Dyadobacter sp. BE32]
MLFTDLVKSSNKLRRAYASEMLRWRAIHVSEFLPLTKCTHSGQVVAVKWSAYRETTKNH